MAERRIAMNAGEIRIDALLPPEMALRAEYLGVRKAEAPLLATFTLALVQVVGGVLVLAGAILVATRHARAVQTVPTA